MERSVSATLQGKVGQFAEVVLAVAVAHGPRLTEQLTITIDGAPVDVEEISAATGTRLHLCRLPIGQLRVEYTATAIGTAPVEPPRPLDRITYLRPSRYCDSDTMAAVAAAEFPNLEGKALLDAVTVWAYRHLSYVAGWSRPIDGAVETFLARAGVCRDFAHLVITLLRARGVPARLAAVYAPGLMPMDFHAVAEAFIDGAWYVVDATRLAPRQSLLRIATGRDAADTAFMSILSGLAELTEIQVIAVVDELPRDDLDALVQLV